MYVRDVWRCMKQRWRVKYLVNWTYIYYLYYTGALHSTLSNIVTCLLEQDPHRDDDVAGPEPALVGGAVRVDLAQHQVQTVLVAVNNCGSVF